jgi:hypothetical protein
MAISDAEYQRRLAELADWHFEWVQRKLNQKLEFEPGGRRRGSDYNQHFVDMDNDDDEFHARAREIMGIADSET